jgi:uncharacterized RDD family membrane protein YckC
MKQIQPEPNIKNRVIATLIDYGIYLTFFIVYVYTFGTPNDEGGYTVSGMKGLPVFVIWFIYFPIVESIGGQTLGHLVTGTRVIDKSGEPVTLIQTLKRRIFDPIDIFFFFGLIGFITVKNSEKHQRVGDLAAGTIVIGGEDANCSYCLEQLTLSPDEKLKGYFTCPSCNKVNEN